jgi:hypothetical protein
MHDVISSTIARIGYEDSSQLLQVNFLNGNIYQYFDVPPAVFQELMASESKGSYLGKFIRGHFRYARM